MLGARSTGCYNAPHSHKERHPMSARYRKLLKRRATLVERQCFKAMRAALKHRRTAH